MPVIAISSVSDVHAAIGTGGMYCHFPEFFRPHDGTE
jgi:hypothetical protein